MISFFLTGCSNKPEAKQPSPSPMTTSSTDITSTSKPNLEPKSVPSLIEYLQSLKLLAQEVDEEFTTIQELKSINDEIRQNHWNIDKRIKSLEIHDLRYPNHIELINHLALAHKYNIYLWQEYQNNDTKKISETIVLIKNELSAFEEMAKKIDAGEINDTPKK